MICVSQLQATLQAQLILRAQMIQFKSYLMVKFLEIGMSIGMRLNFFYILLDLVEILFLDKPGNVKGNSFRE